MLGSPGPAWWRDVPQSDCTTGEGWKQKGFFETESGWKLGGHGGGKQALCERVSLATERMTSWLPSKTRLRASAGYFHVVSIKKKCSKADIKTHTPCFFHLYWNEFFPPLLGLCVVNTESPNVCILLILLCLAFPRLSSVTLCLPPAVVNTTLLW